MARTDLSDRAAHDEIQDEQAAADVGAAEASTPLELEAAATPIFPREQGIFGAPGLADLGLGSRGGLLPADRL